ncbi:UDP-glycosyltransferase UGT5-like [Dendroctonus ponderosae]|uniref:UDP-glucuronosyltransferase n=1 Tax=Dendroctonus ponderosae TaxID=77166 RepID=U4TQQ8_DENPD|nr:UDP-glycosyltransferase UGT5 [Dendroctonus ponderosae]XP_048519858.1 UDP-glycosyltransferase UGT5-like [Dendroctonus ponderosae]ERL83794.1 hypothetical protein D910_01037 [Dendroctonus ponderosae]ERL85974.1 hypothetical protein D910_03388 [Dendroctonus ponderosae]KAH1025957.1 hypothetical protein HUJ05_010558 [Dendroctonus ponderosae]KAH1025958.1 hypothetical protein HUJ05_010559 [Dendroctonus ponderosae]
MNPTWVIFLAILCNGGCNGARLLGVFPIPVRSHYTLAFKLMQGLAEAGHQVTVIAPFPAKNVPSNVSWEHVVVEGIAEEYHKKFKDMNLLEDSNRNVVERMVQYQNLMVHWINDTLWDPKVKALLTPATKFDAVVLEQFMNDAHKAYAHFFDCPLILISSMGAAPWVNNIVGNPNPPAYIRHIFFSSTFDYTKIWTRFGNLVTYITEFLVDYFYSQPLHNRLIQARFPGAPSVEELNKRTALVLLNSHESLMEPVPLVPNMVHIGGYHIEPPKPLPDDLQQFMDKATDGVIYFSMGGNIKGSQMRKEKLEIFFNAFRKLKQKVIWKFEVEKMPGFPDNVLMKSWLPQQDILAHPNVKLFITHGGLLSTTETVYHGVPVLAIPIYGDQYMNAENAVRYGYGLMLGYNDKNFNYETFSATLNELLNNPKYMKSARQRSQIFHDRPLTPMESTVYWVEYVIRNNGAKHLQVSGANLPIYKYLMLDILASIIAALAIAWISLKTIIRLIVSKLKRSKKEKRS